MIKKPARSETRARRHQRHRVQMWGTSKRPRLSIFRSKRHIYAQLIDDDHASTLVSASSVQEGIKLPKAPKSAAKVMPAAKAEKKKVGPPQKTAPLPQVVSPKQDAAGTPHGISRPQQVARSIGEAVARKALEKGITEVIFDRGGFKFHGRVKAVADGAREAGLKF